MPAPAHVQHLQHTSPLVRNQDPSPYQRARSAFWRAITPPPERVQVYVRDRRTPRPRAQRRQNSETSQVTDQHHHQHHQPLVNAPSTGYAGAYKETLIKQIIECIKENQLQESSDPEVYKKFTAVELTAKFAEFKDAAVAARKKQLISDIRSVYRTLDYSEEFISSIIDGYEPTLSIPVLESHFIELKSMIPPGSRRLLSSKNKDQDSSSCPSSINLKPYQTLTIIIIIISSLFM